MNSRIVQGIVPLHYHNRNSDWVSDSQVLSAFEGQIFEKKFRFSRVYYEEDLCEKYGAPLGHFIRIVESNYDYYYWKRHCNFTQPVSRLLHSLLWNLPSFFIGPRTFYNWWCRCKSVKHKSNFGVWWEVETRQERLPSKFLVLSINLSMYCVHVIKFWILSRASLIWILWLKLHS